MCVVIPHTACVEVRGPLVVVCLSLPTMWVLGNDFRSRGLVGNTFTC